MSLHLFLFNKSFFVPSRTVAKGDHICVRVHYLTVETSAVEAFSKKSDFFNKCNQVSWHKYNQVFFCCENSDFFQHLHPSLFDDRLTSGHLVWNIPEKISGTVWLLYLQFTCLKAEVVTMHFRLDDNHGAQFLGPVSYLKSTRSIDKFETIIPWKFF